MTTTALLSGSLADYEAGPATPSNSHTHTSTITISANKTNEAPTPEIDRKSPIHSFRHLHHVSKPTNPPSADRLLTLFKVALAFEANIKALPNPEPKPKTKNPKVISRMTPQKPSPVNSVPWSDLPPCSSFTAADQGMLERLVAPRNRSESCRG